MNISDEELLYLAMCGSEEAFYELYNIYYHLVWKLARDCIYKDNHVLDIDDIVADSLSIFIKLIQQYRSDKNASLRTYIKICIKNRIYTSIQQQYKIFLNNPMVLRLEDKVDEQKTIGDYLLKTPKEQQPDMLMVIEESVEEYKSYSLDVLSAKEKEVYKYLSLGYSSAEISDIMGISLKSCYNAVYRISKKMSNFNMTLTTKKKCDTLK